MTNIANKDTLIKLYLFENAIEFGTASAVEFLRQFVESSVRESFVIEAG